MIEKIKELFIKDLPHNLDNWFIYLFRCNVTTYFPPFFVSDDQFTVPSSYSDSEGPRSTSSSTDLSSISSSSHDLSSSLSTSEVNEDEDKYKVWFEIDVLILRDDQGSDDDHQLDKPQTKIRICMRILEVDQKSTQKVYCVEFTKLSGTTQDFIR